MKQAELRSLWVKRITTFVLGIIIMSFGITLAMQANIGVPPGGVISFALSKITIFSVGWCITFFHIICILTQLIISRRFSMGLALQLLLAFFQGRLMDFFLWLLPINPENMLISLAILCAGIIILSFGIRALTGAAILLLPPDSVALVAGEKLGWDFPKSKLASDVLYTVIAAILMFFFSNEIFSVVGIGTIISAIATGPVVGLYTKLFPGLDFSMTDTFKSSISYEVIKPNRSMPDWLVLFTTKAGTEDEVVSFKGDDNEERNRLQEQTGFDSLSWLKLEHSNKVLILPEENGVPSDAGVCFQTGEAIALTTADCLPIAFVDNDSRTFALAHAGWRSLASGVIKNTIEKMNLESLSEVFVWIGPSIACEDFEIGAEVREELMMNGHALEEHFMQGNPGKYYADLRAIASYQMKEIGILNESIEIFEPSTLRDKTLHSFRRDGEKSGRMATLIGRKK